MAETVPTIAIVVAVANHGVIGVKNALPWHLPEDLAHFKATTLGHCLIMGRKTFESIGRPLPKRRTIVVSHNAHLAIPGVATVTSLRAAIDHAVASGESKIFIVGGAQIYEQGLAFANEVVLTRVALTVEGDAFFAPLLPEEWELLERTEHMSGAGIAYSIERYRRAAT
jgi:dihydrofolate reductase